ncbi:hypothetical protein FRC08_009847 [Ceratobasidium sp. 394]|nr:hypothetical protein FRC08_009847 [Ceratobasidium sp. 394]
MPLNDACVPAFVGFILSYHLLAPYCTTTKQRAWILTAMSSSITSVAALPYAYDFFASGCQLDTLRPTTDWSDRVVGLFQGYLIADLAIGVVYYRKYVSLMTGWVHHTLYFTLLQYVLSVGWTNIFCLALIMEIPTFLLSAGSLNPRWRSDYLFATVFFATRIVLHLYLIYGYTKLYLVQPSLAQQAYSVAPELNISAIPKVQAPTISTLPTPHTSPLPAIFFLAALPMHLIWFNACVSGILRRRAQSRSTAASTPVLVSSVRTRFQAVRHRLRLSREGRERLRARLGAMYGNARERVLRRGGGVWVRVYGQLYD